MNSRKFLEHRNNRDQQELEETISKLEHQTKYQTQQGMTVGAFNEGADENPFPWILF